MTVLKSKPKIKKKYDRTLSRGPNGFNQQKLLARLSLGLVRDTSLKQNNCNFVFIYFFFYCDLKALKNLCITVLATKELLKKIVIQ